MARFFNTTGPCRLADHYMLATAARLPDVMTFVERKQCFAFHAPRQTGKTTAMRALAETLRSQGIAGCWATLEASQGVDDTAQAEPLWLRALHRASLGMPSEWQAPTPGSGLHPPPTASSCARSSTTRRS
jgi:hypothetical protein